VQCGGETSGDDVCTQWLEETMAKIGDWEVRDGVQRHRVGTNELLAHTPEPDAKSHKNEASQHLSSGTLVHLFHIATMCDDISDLNVIHTVG